MRKVQLLGGPADGLKGSVPRGHSRINVPIRGKTDKGMPTYKVYEYQRDLTNRDQFIYVRPI